MFSRVGHRRFFFDLIEAALRFRRPREHSRARWLRDGACAAVWYQQGGGWFPAGIACGRVPTSRKYAALAFWLRAEYVSLFLDRGAKGPGVWSPIAACVRGARGWFGLGRALGVSLGTDVRTTLRCSKPAPYVLLFSKAGCDTGGCGKHS